MAAAQLFVSGSAAKKCLSSPEGLLLPLSRSRVSSSKSVELRRNKCLRSPFLRICKTDSRKLSVNMCLNESSSTGVVVNTAKKYAEDIPDQSGEPVKVNTPLEPVDGSISLGMDVEEAVVPPKRSAKIHDFCLGIPYGGIVFSGGLLGFIFSRNPASLTTGVLLGGAVLALSVFSLKVWRSGRSSLPFILGQAVIAAALLRKQLLSYSLSKKIFPTGLSIFLSAAMICFYSYVLLSGGNPAPKKKKTAASMS